MKLNELRRYQLEKQNSWQESKILRQWEPRTALDSQQTGLQLNHIQTARTLVTSYSDDEDLG